MSDYISREDVKKLLWERISLATFMRRGISNAMKSLSLISEKLEEIPAADVRPVVRCGECIRKDICRSSNIWAVSPDDNWFCADGERRDGGADG